MYSIEDPAEREKRIKAKVAKANAEGRELPLEGTQEDVSAAMSQAFQKMSPEQKKILRDGLLQKVYGKKSQTSEGNFLESAKGSQ